MDGECPWSHPTVTVTNNGCITTGKVETESWDREMSSSQQNGTCQSRFTCILKQGEFLSKPQQRNLVLTSHSDGSCIHEVTQLTRACLNFLYRCRRSSSLYYFVFHLQEEKKAYRLLFLLLHPESYFCEGRNKKRRKESLTLVIALKSGREIHIHLTHFSISPSFQ